MAECPNCGSETVLNYCAQCGQRQRRPQSVRAFARDVADDQLGVDAKLPRTLAALFAKPGLLTREYMQGRIARYIPPFRLYLLTSILFFVLLSFLSQQSDWAEQAAREIERERSAADSVALANSTRLTSDTAAVPARTSWLDSAQINVPWRWLDQKLETNIRALATLPPNMAMRRVTDATIEELPKVMFLLLPVYAFLLKLFYLRRRRYYVEHFVFALHVHACAFLLFTIALVFRESWMLPGVLLAMALYTLLAMKRVYEQGVVKTLLKWLVLGYAYTFLLAFGLIFALIWALAGALPA